jgi:hypothetical protein
MTPFTKKAEIKAQEHLLAFHHKCSHTAMKGMEIEKRQHSPKGLG